MNYNWIALDGKASIDEKEIRFIPEIANDQQLRADKTPACGLASNIEFENGEIIFKVKINDNSTRCQIVLNRGFEEVFIGINTGNAAFGIIKLVQNTFVNLDSSGDPNNLDFSKPFLIKIKVIGSIISLYINEVLVAKTSHIIKKSYINLFITGINEAVIFDFIVNQTKPCAFVVMQFTDEYNTLYDEVIKPICQEKGLDCIRADDFFSSTPIITDIVNSIKTSSIIIADITPNNPNVFYEIGYAHAIDKPTILLCDRKRDKLPFDISGFRTLFYDNTISGKSKIEENLKKFLDNSI